MGSPLSHLASPLRQILTDSNPKARLDQAAFEIAQLHAPDLGSSEHDPQPYLDQLNELAANLGDRLRNFNDGREFVEKAQSYLFGELGFQGNMTDYYDPLNNCLDHVLDRRVGNPITLSVLYMEIARRLQMPVYGISLPGHFVVQFDDRRYATYVDPFGGGEAITIEKCFTLAGAKVPDPALLRRATNKQIVMRMLHNLHGSYVRLHDIPRAVAALDLLILGAPQDATWHKLRGMFHLKLKRYGSAREDLEKYLAYTPDAADRTAVLQQLQSIHQWLAQNN
ncbi:MAG: transglutaminase-like domain-containing protein [Acidobacteriota bacterium]